MSFEHYNQAYFDEMERYAKREGHLKHLYRSIRKRKPKTVLDVGCGHGYLVHYFLERGLDAHGLDVSPYAGIRIKDHFTKGEATALPFPDQSFDIIISSDFFEHVPEADIDMVAMEMARVGKVVLAYISYKEENRKTGIDTHETVKPPEWWETRLAPYHILIIGHNHAH
jgi:ubiquinone/menaquinone biosynthesis C-methylase UbiE